MVAEVKKAVDHARAPPSGGGARGTESEVRKRESTLAERELVAVVVR